MRRSAMQQQHLATERHGRAPDIGAAHVEPDGPCPGHRALGERYFIKARYSRLPAAPSIGDSIAPATSSPSSSANLIIPSTVSRRSFSSRTTPDLPTLPLPTSNCGLISAIISAGDLISGNTAGITRRSEMKLVSIVTRFGM